MDRWVRARRRPPDDAVAVAPHRRAGWVMHRLLNWYYAATPAFWLVDVLGGPSVRVAFLDGFPIGQQLYYVLCCGIAVVTWRRPERAGQLAFIESAANIALLMVSVMIWYAGMIDWAGEPTAVVTAPSPAHVANFIIAAAFAGVGYEVRRARHARQPA